MIWGKFSSEMYGRGLLCFVLAALVCLYWKVIGYPFLLWDDDIYVTGRPLLHHLGQGDWSALWSLLSPQQALSGRFWEYFPLRDASYALDAWIGSMSPSAFHFSNLLLHLISTLIVALLGRRLGLAWPYAAVAAAVFGLHPLAVEPVVWVSGRKDLLYACFSLLALYCFLVVANTQRKTAWLAWVGVYVFAVMALLSKGAGIVVVALLLWAALWHSPQQWLRRVMAFIPLVVVAGMWLLLVLYIGYTNKIIRTAAGVGELALWQRAFVVIGEPIWAAFKILLPLDLSPSYLHSSKESNWWMDPHSWLMLLLLVLVGIRWRKQRQVSGLFLWSAVAFVLAVLPSSGLIPVNQYRADRFVYLALAFGGLFCAGILQHIQRWRTYAALVSLVFIGFWTVQSYKYSEVWRSDLSLWSYVHGKDPFHPEANINIGSIAIRHGDLDTAEKYLERVFRKMPDSYHAWINLGLVWLYQAMQLSDDQPSNRRHVLIQKAEKAFRYTLSRYPEHTAMPLLGLAKIARIRGQHTQAEDFLRRGLNHKRTNVGILLELADLLKETKREEQASLLIRQYKPQFGHLPRFQQWIKKHLQAPPNTSTP